MGIQIKPSHKGRLHKATGVTEGKSIPLSKLAEALHSDKSSVRKMAQFASNAKSWGK